MAQNVLNLINRSLVMIGTTPIQGLTDTCAEASVMNDVYAGVRDGMLSAYAWQFASRLQDLQRVETPTDEGFVYALPNDMLRLLQVFTHTYDMRGGLLYTGASSVRVQYIFRPEETDFPAYFDTALVARLAAECCLPLTDSTTRTEFLYKQAERELQKSRLIDASQLVNSALDVGILTDIR